MLVYKMKDWVKEAIANQQRRNFGMVGENMNGEWNTNTGTWHISGGGRHGSPR